ncbi:hypothetical protein E5288_WYG013142 [Bos mutus]|uniref:Uncharacterized protein n=1 Tax=Bos mutus TaxID=72004 RepID=A0A6B0R9S7_9CETA|nr:hypothetical protein [Bos mutus]
MDTNFGVCIFSRAMLGSASGPHGYLPLPVPPKGKTAIPRAWPCPQDSQISQPGLALNHVQVSYSLSTEDGLSSILLKDSGRFEIQDLSLVASQVMQVESKKVAQLIRVFGFLTRSLQFLLPPGGERDNDRGEGDQMRRL